MLNDYLTMAAAAVFAVIVVYALRHALRKFAGLELPKWFTPAAAGLAMLFATIWGEYRWFPDTLARMGDRVVVVSANQDSAPWRPWTYLWPITSRFAVLDLQSQSRPAPGVVTATLYLVARWQPTQPVSVAYDCKARAQAVLGGEAAVREDGTLTAGGWSAVAADDAGLNSVCREG